MPLFFIFVGQTTNKMKTNKIAVACDHAGYETKVKIIEHLKEKGYEITDFGTYSAESSDYADYAHPLASAVENREFELGVTLCGSGNGINMTVNKHRGIRAALCWNAEISELARRHNDANICAVPARFVSIEDAIEIIDIFLNTGFDGGRHLRRIKKIPLS